MDKPAPLTQDEIAVLLRRLPGWTVENNELVKEYKFKDFTQSMSFVNRLVPYFESVDHHPDMLIRYSRVRFTLSRHDIGGKITALDGDVAGQIEQEFSVAK
jgi:4a-hydroxytetrahydrobiopterin dehydratase